MATPFDYLKNLVLIPFFKKSIGLDYLRGTEIFVNQGGLWATLIMILKKTLKSNMMTGWNLTTILRTVKDRLRI